MNSPLSPFLELLNGEAYRPHPEDAALSMGKRFAGMVVVVVGGGATPNGWTQRIAFDRMGVPRVEAAVRGPFRRGSDEWLDHLTEEARGTSGWAIALVEKWQAAMAAGSVVSQGGRGVERMLRVREDWNTFGGSNITEDAIRVSVDHPSMEIGVTAGVKREVLENIEKEITSAGLKLAAVRVACFSILETYLAELHRKKSAPDRTIVAFDGYSALIVGVSSSAFDTNEGGVSYIVSRPQHVREQIIRKLTDVRNLRQWGNKVIVIGSPLEAASVPEAQALEIEERLQEPALAVTDGESHHDFRLNLQPVREPLPIWVRSVFVGVLLLMAVTIAAIAFYASDVVKFQNRISAREAEKNIYDVAAASAKNRMQELRRERERAIALGQWVSINYHAETLLQDFLQVLPTDVSLDSVSLKADEGRPQLQLQFTLVGNEEPQRSALRLIEQRLYALGYDISRREDPKASTKRRGGVEHTWYLIIPTFGR